MSSPRDWRPGFDQQTARINVSDDTWRAFRRLCLDDDEPVSVALGRLVDHQVARRRPAPRPATDQPAQPRADTSTREHQPNKPAERPATSTSATRPTPTLFDA